METTFKKTIYKDSEVQWGLENIEDRDGENIEYILIYGVTTPVSSRGQGQARACLKKALEEIKASYPDVMISICAEPQDDTTTLEGLVSFYSSLGFRLSDEQGGSGVIMEM